MDTAEESTEIDQSKIALPPISGKVSFENLYFRFSLNSPEVLKNINLNIPPGKFGEWLVKAVAEKYVNETNSSSLLA